MKTNAYPNYDWYMPQKPAQNLSKWTQAAREIYYVVYKGGNKQDAFNKITDNWDKMEKLDFKNWLRFYEENGQNKYKEAQVKTAQFWNDLPRFDQQQTDMTAIKNPNTHPDLLQEERRNTIERQRHKIISRLDSAEKLLRSQEGQLFAGSEYEQLMEILYQLKKKIQLVNKISTSVRLYENMIIREANILNSKGLKDASSFLVKIAQELPSVQEPQNPIQIGDGQAGSLPGEAPGEVEPPAGDIPIDVSMPDKPIPGVPQNAAQPDLGVAPTTTPNLPQQEVLSQGLKDFLDGLDTGSTSTEEDDEENETNDFVVEAQLTQAEPPLEVEEDPINPQQDPEVATGKDVDGMLDNTFAHITIADTVEKLESIAKIFREREVVRQLEVADIMLDRLGLASLFPTLAEVTQKNLENVNYSITRLEDIISKLRGTLNTKNIDLINKNAPSTSQEAAQAKQILEDREKKQQEKKQMRKQLEEDKLTKPQPQIEMRQDLNQPAELQPAEAPAVLPAAPPIGRGV